MSNNVNSPPPADRPEPAATRTFSLNEDWLATVVGLALLVLIVVGAIPPGVIP